MLSRATIYKTLCAIMLLAVGAAAQAVVVRGGDTVRLREGQDANFDANYFLTVNQTAGPDYNGTGIWIKKTDSFWSFQSTLTVATYNLDEGADLYLSSAGDVLSGGLIDQEVFSPLLAFGQRGSVDVAYPGTFYLAIVTGEGWNGASPNRNVFGWAKFQNSYAGLTLVDSAMAYGEGGIVVGSFTALPLPEASTWLQMTLGLIGVLLFVLVRTERAENVPA